MGRSGTDLTFWPVFAPQDWGRPGDLFNLQIQWHVPNPEEVAFVFDVLDLLLRPELQRLQKYAQGEQGMNRCGPRGEAVGPVESGQRWRECCFVMEREPKQTGM